MKNTIKFCGTECEIIKRYEISEDYTKENMLDSTKRIKFITPNGDIIDCADNF